VRGYSAPLRSPAAPSADRGAAPIIQLHGAAQFIHLRPLHPTTLNQADLVAAAAGSTAQWVNGYEVTDTARSDQLPPIVSADQVALNGYGLPAVLPAIAYEPLTEDHPAEPCGPAAETAEEDLPPIVTKPDRHALEAQAARELTQESEPDPTVVPLQARDPEQQSDLLGPLRNVSGTSAAATLSRLRQATKQLAK
jgi:hypothetical protein